jgi:exopolysaccharide production protein ExoY
VGKTSEEISMKGFVQKTERPTKGGSLPSTVGARELGRFFLRYFFRQNGSNGTNGTAEKQTSSTVTFPQRFNETRRHTDDATASRHEVRSSRNGATSIDNEYPPSLQKLMVEFVSSERTESLGSDARGEVRPFGNGAVSKSIFAYEHERATLPYAELEEVVPASVPRWKRILDLTCVCITLPCWLPLMILVMLWIRVVSPGPVFFRQARVGHGRRHFMIFKFRTMRVNAETRTHAEYFAHLMQADCPMTKLDVGGDPRLIACGRFLRASGLDELPQIFNVILGDMSLVGPRPCLPHEFERYEVWQQQRVKVLPGLTGYWQVNGKNHTTFSEMIAMDMFYAQNMSLRLDLAIILKTVPALVVQTREARAAARGRSFQQAIHQTHR